MNRAAGAPPAAFRVPLDIIQADSGRRKQTCLAPFFLFDNLFKEIFYFIKYCFSSIIHK
jgi:hypothetical protein